MHCYSTSRSTAVPLDLETLLSLDIESFKKFVEKTSIFLARSINSRYKFSQPCLTVMTMSYKLHVTCFCSSEDLYVSTSVLACRFIKESTVLTLDLAEQYAVLCSV